MLLMQMLSFEYRQMYDKIVIFHDAAKRKSERQHFAISIITSFPLLKKIHDFHLKFPITFVLWVYLSGFFNRVQQQIK